MKTATNPFLKRLAGLHAAGWRRWRANCPRCGAFDALVVELSKFDSLGVECTSIKRCRTLAVLEALKLDVPVLFGVAAGGQAAEST